MSLAKFEKSEGAQQSIKLLRSLFATDIVMLQLAGLRSICSVLISELDEPNNWETIFFVKGIVPIAIFISLIGLALVKMWSDDRDYAINLFTVLFDSILCAIKGIRLLCQRRELRDILERLKISWDETINSSIADHVTKSAEQTSFLCKFYIQVTIFFAFTYAIRPYLLLSYYYVFLKNTNISYDSSQTIYPIPYPFPINSMSTYVLIIIAEQVTVIFHAIYWLTCDTMFAKLCTHGAIQFRVLSNDLEDVDTAMDDERVLIHRLSIIANRHLNALELEIKLKKNIATRKIRKYCKKINSVFNPIFFLTMVFTSANLCICAFQLDKELSRSNYAEAIKHLSHAITVAIQFSIYCSHAEKITDQSLLMAKAAYNCSWINHCQEFKTNILILLLRAQISFRFNGYGFFSINVGQITRVTNTALSYFAILKTIA